MVPPDTNASPQPAVHCTPYLRILPMTKFGSTIRYAIAAAKGETEVLSASVDVEDFWDDGVAMHLDRC